MDRDNEKKALLSSTRRTRNSRSCCATCCSSCSAVLYFAILLFSLLYFGFFLHLALTVSASEPYSGQCILFGRSSQKENRFTLDENVSCELSIFGSAVLVFLELMLLVMLTCNSIWGRWVICLKVFEVFVLGVCVGFSIVISLVLSLGYSLTCNAQRMHESVTKSCMELKLPELDLDYGNRMLIIEIVSWLVTVMFILDFLLQLLISLCLCCKQRRRTSYSARYNERNLR